MPGAYAAVAEFLPDLIVHESCEFSGPLAAERVSGRQLDQLFDAWLFQEGRPTSW